MIERTIPTNIGGVMPTNEQKKEIYKGKHITISYYPDRVIHPKYYLQVLKDKILFPVNMLRFKFAQRTYMTIKKRI